MTGFWNTTKALKAGIGLVPEDRKTQGFLSLSSNTDNVSISSLEKYMTGVFVDEKKKEKNAERFFEEMDVHPRRIDYLTKNMSGGNQQKVIFGKWLERSPQVFMMDEPTRGIDVAAKVEIYNLMNQLKKAGIGVLFVSSEMPEIMGMSDRILVMCDGRITGELSHDEVTQDKILTLATRFENKLGGE